MSEVSGTERGPSAVRIGLGAAGVFTLIAAFVLVDESVEAAVTAMETTLGSDYLLAASLGGVALVFAASAFASGATAMRQAAMPEVERPTPVPAPGDELDRQLSGWRNWLPFVGSTARDGVRQRLRRIAVRVVAADVGCGREEAERRVDEGTWTDDPVAAAFLDPEPERPPPAIRLAALRRGETWIQYSARHTVEALVDCHNDDGSTNR